MFPRRFRARVFFALPVLSACLFVLVRLSSRDTFKGQRQFLNLVSQNPSSVQWWNNFFAGGKRGNCEAVSPESRTLLTGDVYPELDFSSPDRGEVGFWDKTLETRYREWRKTWKFLPLQVIVVPHSHVDPGWLRTYDDYYKNVVTDILDNMVLFLNKTKQFTFIWGEISFFSQWWNKQNEEVRSIVSELVASDRLEFVSGGWVMPDEATTSYFGLLDQLIEGHQWLQHFMGILPRCSWSVDVFGHSSTLPHVLSSAGISHMVILRTHYAWKRFLALNRAFDFYWENPTVLCHMCPSALYSFKYVCGPDPSACLKYDFRRVGGEYSESTADAITANNLQLKADFLLSQYARYASLFPHNVLLVPLGDDFRYNVYTEWVQQFENYQKLFDYINNNKNMNAHIRFGTVADYFKEVKARLRNNISLPFVKGDFFPYADVYADSQPSYWSGFYTTRPFYKIIEQELERWLRTAEILYSLSNNLVSYIPAMRKKDFLALISARQSLGLFQHHDAITGTSRDYVMSDYVRKLHAALVDTMSITSHAAQSLLMGRIPEGKTWTSQVYPDVYRAEPNGSTRQLTISVPENGRKIILFNPLTVERSEIIRLKVRSSYVSVLDANSKNIPSQINPVYKNAFAMSNSVFELIFVAVLRPLSFSTYTIVKTVESDSNRAAKGMVSVFVNDGIETLTKNSAFEFQKPSDKEIIFDSPKIQVKFTRLGIMKEIYLKESGISKSLNIDFGAYLPKPYRSGAYLFHPDSHETTPLRNLTQHFPAMCIVRGPLVSELNVIYGDIFRLSVRVNDFKGAREALELIVATDISKISKDVELIMRIKSDIQNNGAFYTDANGYQMHRRKYVRNQPIQANYYPITSSFFIEDDNFRLNLLVSHAHGGTSPLPGVMEIMLDRRMRNDDFRGMSQGIQDNRLISLSFWLFAESTTGGQITDSAGISQEAYILSLLIRHPVIVLITDSADAKIIKPQLMLLTEAWPSDVHLVNFRTLPLKENYHSPSDSSLLIIYERQDSCKTINFVDSVIKGEKSSLFSNIEVKSVVKTSLTGITPLPLVNFTSNFVNPEALQACKITFR